MWFASSDCTKKRACIKLTLTYSVQRVALVMLDVAAGESVAFTKSTPEQCSAIDYANNRSRDCLLCATSSHDTTS